MRCEPTAPQLLSGLALPQRVELLEGSRVVGAGVLRFPAARTGSLPCANHAGCYLKRIAAVIGLGHHLPLGVRYHVTRKAVAGLQANFRIN